MPEMTARERYRAVMGFQPGVRTLMWEFGYWAATVDRWYGEGLRRSWYSLPPDLPPGASIFAEGLSYPEESYRSDIGSYRVLEVHDQLRLDEGAVRVPLNWRCCPQFARTTLQEDDNTRLVMNQNGVTFRVNKTSVSLPQFLAWPVKDRTSWERIKEERFGPDIMARFPSRWEVVVKSYQDRDYPLGPIMDGFFSTPRELMGLVNQLMMYYDDPRLMHDINDHLTTTWLAMLEQLVSEVDLDFVYVWEDMSFKNGPLISPAMFREFIVPYYRRITGFLRAHHVEIVFVDTDGDCSKLIPGFLEAGVTGLYPFEVQAGMDVVAIRKQYPKLLVQGGLDKLKVAKGKDAIDAELDAKLPFMLSQGGYIPYCDHLVHPDVSWENFRYYREQLNRYIERYTLR
jgi:hypothetical protein